MILALLLQAAAPAAPVPGPLPKQAIPSRGCAAYLWSVAERRFVAMASAEPASLRLMLDGKVVDVARSGGEAADGFGLAPTTTYAGDGVTATLAMTVAVRAELSGGAAVPAGTLTIGRSGGDSVVVPVAGLIGCAPA